MHKKNRSKKGPRQPPQCDVTKVSSVVPEATPQAVNEAEESNNEQRVPDPNPQPISDTQISEITQIETSATNIPPKPKRHRAGRKKRQPFDKNESNKDDFVNKDTTEENVTSSAVIQEFFKSEINTSDTSNLISECKVQSIETTGKINIVKGGEVAPEVTAVTDQKEKIVLSISSKGEKEAGFVSNIESKSLSFISDVKSTTKTVREEIKSKAADSEALVCSPSNIVNEIAIKKTEDCVLSQNIPEQEKSVQQILDFPTINMKNEPKAKGRGKKSKNKGEIKSEYQESTTTSSSELLNKGFINQSVEENKCTVLKEDSTGIENKSDQLILSIDNLVSEDKHKHIKECLKKTTNVNIKRNSSSVEKNNEKSISEVFLKADINLERRQQDSSLQIEENIMKDINVEPKTASNLEYKNLSSQQENLSIPFKTLPETLCSESPSEITFTAVKDNFQRGDICLLTNSAESTSKEFMLKTKTSSLIETTQLKESQEFFTAKEQEVKGSLVTIITEKGNTQPESICSSTKSVENIPKVLTLNTKKNIEGDIIDSTEGNQDVLKNKVQKEDGENNILISGKDNVQGEDICLSTKSLGHDSKGLMTNTKAIIECEVIESRESNQVFLTNEEQENECRGNVEVITKKDNTQCKDICMSTKSQNITNEFSTNISKHISSKSIDIKEENEDVITKKELETIDGNKAGLISDDKESVISKLSENTELDENEHNKTFKKKSKNKKQHGYKKEQEITKEEISCSRITSDTSLPQNIAKGTIADFIAGPSEVLVIPKPSDSIKAEEVLDKQNTNLNKKIRCNDPSLSNLSSFDNSCNLNKKEKDIIQTISSIEKQPLLMICDTAFSVSSVKSVIDFKSQDNVDNKTEVVSITNINPGLKIAEEIAESIKEELKCQLAIISGSSDKKMENKILIEQKIEHIGDETEKNVVKNIECVMKTVEQHSPTSMERNAPETFSESHSILSDDDITKMELDKSNDRHAHKGKGKSKKGSKKDKVDSHMSTQLFTDQTSLAASTTQSNEKSSSNNVKQSDTKNNSQSTSTDNKSNSNTETKKQQNSENFEDNTNSENKNVSGIKEQEKEKQNDIADLPVSEDRKHSLQDFEYITQSHEAINRNEKDSKDDDKQSKVIHPKNLLGLPNIPVSSSKVDYKKEKNKSEEIMDIDIARSKLFITNEEHLPEFKEKKKSDNIKLTSSDSISKFLPESVLGNKQASNKVKQHQNFDESEEEFVYKYNFRNVFLANACHLCKMPIQAERSNCKYCHLISYCNDSHKDKDWPQHQPMCYSVTTIMQINGLQHLYSKSKTLSGQEYRILRMQMIVLCEKLLKRKLLPSEQEVLLYPRLCLKQDCKEWQTDKLIECDKCGQVSYCKSNPDHLTVDHEKWCRSYKIYHQLVAHQLEKGKVEPKLPNRILPQGNYSLPDLCSHLMEELYNSNINMDEIHYVTLTQLSTAPLTALYSYQLWKEKCDCKENALVPNEMTIHIVGAEMQFEIDTLNKWEVFFLHLFPCLKQLNLEFIGPELNVSKLPLDLLSRIRLCKFCRQTGRNITIEFKDGILYHDYANGESFNKPDLVCAFNPGLHRTTGFAGQDTWPDTIRRIINMAVPFCVTSYTSQELPRDLTRVLSCCTDYNVKTFVAPRLNPYASLRPDRNFISDDEMPLIFKNYYFMVLSGLSA